MPESNWSQALTADRAEFVRFLRQLIVEHYRNWGEFPSVEWLLAQLGLPR